MKIPTIAALISFGLATFAQADQQLEQLKAYYKAEGDALFVPLYWLPETRQTVLKHIPDHDNWVGFEFGLWKNRTEEEKQKLLSDLAVQFDQMEGAKLDATWRRIRDWQYLSTQIGLLITFMDSEEDWLNLAYQDPVLQPAFEWILKRRPADFPPKHIGGTFASGELSIFMPRLTEHLLNTPETLRYQCFSRLFARIAEIKAAEAKPQQTFEAIREDHVAQARIVERLGKLVLHKVKLDAMPLGEAISELQQLGVKGTPDRGVINVTISGFDNAPRQPADGDDPFEPGEPEPPKPPKMVSLNAESITFVQAVDTLCKQAGYQWSIQFHLPGIPTLAISPSPDGK